MEAPLETADMTKILFAITKEVKYFYETPVIFVTNRDYSDDIFNIMCKIRKVIAENGSKEEIMDVVVDFHLQWLRSVNELLAFQKQIHNVSCEQVLQAISFTIDAIEKRLKYFVKYIENLRSLMSPEDGRNIEIDVEIMEDMNKEVTYFLLDKLKCYRNYTDKVEFYVKLNGAVDELLNYLDKINDRLTLQFTAIIKEDNTQLVTDLTKTLKEIVDEVSHSNDPYALKLIEELQGKGQDLSSMIRCCSARNLEISRVVEKLASLDVRIKLLQSQNSSAVMGLERKKTNLEDRLNSLVDFKSVLQQINYDRNLELKGGVIIDEDTCPCPNKLEARIFNHLLSETDRERLVTNLCYLWDRAVFGEKKSKSMISILSATSIKEEFTDELGTFYVDGYGRKIYKKVDDSTLYQQNDENILVPLNDDPDRVYYYDQCGRYFIDKDTNLRIYKAHATASEYMMGSSGVLLKVKEERDGITYYYDNYGRYYINEEGEHIYREADSFSEYECDGFGNLVRIRNEFELFTSCPDDVHISEESKYLKETVGPALRKCIADAILCQPADPIKYLADGLVKFRTNLELKEKRVKEKEELMIEREIRLAEERAAAELAARLAMQSAGMSEASYDSNLYNYSAVNPDYSDSMGSTNK